MTLDIEFKKQTNKLIRETLDLYKNAGVSPRISEVWHSQNTAAVVRVHVCLLTPDTHRQDRW